MHLRRQQAPCANNSAICLTVERLRLLSQKLRTHFLYREMRLKIISKSYSVIIYNDIIHTNKRLPCLTLRALQYKSVHELIKLQQLKRIYNYINCIIWLQKKDLERTPLSDPD